MTADEVKGLGTNYRLHDVFRTDMPGLVEVWPVTTGEEKQSCPYLMPDLTDNQDNDARHASAVVAHIKGFFQELRQSCLVGQSAHRTFVLVLTRYFLCAAPC